MIMYSPVVFSGFHIFSSAVSSRAPWLQISPKKLGEGANFSGVGVRARVDPGRFSGFAACS